MIKNLLLPKLLWWTCLLLAAVSIPAGLLLNTSGKVTAFMIGLFLLLPCFLTGTVLITLTRNTAASPWRLVRGPVLCLLVILSVMLGNWPFKLAYQISRPALDRIAANAMAGEAVTTPQRAGLFVIHKVEQSRDGIWCLWTALNPSGKDGFVLTSPDNVPFDLFDMSSMDERWQFIMED